MRALALIFAAGCASAGAAESPAARGGAPVVIELFTSQGCNSCPPADQLVGELARAGRSGGRAIAPLVFHVDYWNDLGWADPFSQPAWTARQAAYARALGDANVYTPELVVAGGAGMNGAQPARIAAAIAAAPEQIAVRATAAWSAGSVMVDATAPADAAVWVAIWEDAPPTAVPAGENSGATLPADRVVRRLVQVAEPGQADHAVVPLDPSWHPGGAVAFEQRADRRIVGATVLSR